MSRIVIINGVRVSYNRTCSTDKPDGTLIFLHGWGGTNKSWDTNVEDLSKKFDCVTIDLPGFGVSSEPDKVWGVEEYAKFVKDFAHALGITKFALVGKSFGGRVAIYYASKWPNSLSHLVLVASAGVEKKGPVTQVTILVAKLVKVLLHSVGGKNLEKLEPMLFKAAGISRDQDYKWEVKKLVTNTDLAKEASQISVPTLIVWGNNDQILPIKWGKVLNQKISNSRLRQIPGGHNAHIESPKDFNNLLTAFLSNKRGLV